MGKLHNWLDKFKKNTSDGSESSSASFSPANKNTDDDNFFDLIEKALADSKKTEEEMLSDIVPSQDEHQTTVSETSSPRETTDIENIPEKISPAFLSSERPEEKESSMASQEIPAPEAVTNDVNANQEEIYTSLDTTDAPFANQTPDMDLSVSENMAPEIEYSSDSPGLSEQTLSFDTDDLDTTAVQNAVSEAENDFSEYAPKHNDVSKDQLEEKTFVDLAHLDEFEKEKEKEKKESKHRIRKITDRFTAFIKKHKIASISTAVVCGVIVCILVLTLIIQTTLDPLRGYTQLAAAKGNVIQTLTANGSVSPIERYGITSLVTGEIVECNYEVGDTVKAGDVLYKFDDTDAQLAVQIAQNEVDKAKSQQDATEAEIDNLRIYAPVGGTIENLSISRGSAVRGGQICQIRVDEETVIPVIPNINGTVQSLSVSEGSSVRSGALIATLSSATLNAEQEENVLNEQSSELTLQSAQKYLENHSIKSPIDGVIVSKEAKVGDNITAINDDTPMMVISNTSSMKFTIEIDETEIWDMKVGQTVIVTATAIPGETFGGEVTKIASEGNVKGNGITTFDVEITIQEPGELKAGMNVQARVIQNSATGVITLPVEALLEPDGQNALVIVKDQETQGEDAVLEESMQNAEEKAETDASLFPWIEVPKGCSLVTVKYGISDGTNVEILSGIQEGDIVCYLPNETKGEYNIEPTEQEIPRDNTATDRDTSSNADDSDQNTDRSTQDRNTNQNEEDAEPTSTSSASRSRNTASPTQDRENTDDQTQNRNEDLFSEGSEMIL